MKQLIRKGNMKKYLLTLVALACTLFATAQTPAFPGAEGHGRYVTGGRGGTVIHVTNLNDKGAGSFRNAVSGNSKRSLSSMSVVSYLLPVILPLVRIPLFSVRQHPLPVSPYVIIPLNLTTTSSCVLSVSAVDRKRMSMTEQTPSQHGIRLV